MKRIAVFLYAVLLLTGCQQQGTGHTAEFESISMPYVTLEEIAGLMQADADTLEMGMRAYGIVENKNTCLISVKVSDEEKYGKSSGFQDSYIIIATEQETMYYEVGDGSYFADKVYLCDVDGDGSDEIVVQQLTAISGGAGGYRSFVFKAENGELIELFQSYYGDYRFDTGFTNTLKDGWLVEISNSFTGYKATLDFSNTKDYEDVYFNADGSVIDDQNSGILVDSFLKFVPEDPDNDGIYEIVCEQYVSLYSHMDAIGHAKSILKYDNDSGEFIVADAEFIPNNSRLRAK